MSISALRVHPILVDQFLAVQVVDAYLQGVKTKIELNELPMFLIKDDNMTCFGNRVCVPEDQKLKRKY